MATRFSVRTVNTTDKREHVVAHNEHVNVALVTASWPRSWACALQKQRSRTQ